METHFPLRNPIDIYQSLISPYITYRLSVWGKSHLNKILLVQTHALRLMYLAKAKPGK